MSAASTIALPKNWIALPAGQPAPSGYARIGTGDVTGNTVTTGTKDALYAPFNSPLEIAPPLGPVGTLGAAAGEEAAAGSEESAAGGAASGSLAGDAATLGLAVVLEQWVTGNVGKALTYVALFVVGVGLIGYGARGLAAGRGSNA